MTIRLNLAALCDCGSADFRYTGVNEGSEYDVVCRECGSPAPDGVLESQIVEW